MAELDRQPADTLPRVHVPLLFMTIFVVAGCGLIYELTAGALASYVLGDSIMQFSTVIGCYLSALGLGAWLSRYVERNVVERFIAIELAVGLIGGTSAPLLFFAFSELTWFRVVLYGLVVLIGTLVGLEVPLLMRILRQRLEFKELIARVLSVDYLGALVASLAFPMFFVPKLGLTRTSLVFGLLNTAIAFWTTYLLRDEIRRPAALRMRCAFVLVTLSAGIAFADRLTSLAEDGLYNHDIVFAKQSAYQRIVVTRSDAGFQLFLDGNLQFASSDEYRYHEALVHPAFAAAEQRARVLVLGGGDGLALREILKYPEVQRVTLVDLDPAMTELGSRFPLLRRLNGASFEDPRVRVVHDDAMRWLADQTTQSPYDVIIVDFPDPNNFSLGKLYTTRFYALVRQQLAAAGALVVQSTSPLFARRSFWCIAQTLRAAGFAVQPYHATVPSFGEWGYVLARTAPFHTPTHAPLPQSEDPRYVDDAMMAALFVWSPDMREIAAEPNRLDNQVLVRYYEDEWKHWN
ncbi:MAG TPA: polyamine aminopropyltransferase [Polyangiales bacterium]|nr:polyamine aminopropyltransferase [Polyangiales bacterium]